ncbi:hypothetical protein [Variovorax sp.]|nr:hypothetical protein [Variovorax sp.]HYP84853.1 hypothetical protein [Variovorax sp.]
MKLEREDGLIYRLRDAHIDAAALKVSASSWIDTVVADHERQQPA